MKLSGNANNKQKAHIEVKSAAEGIGPLHSYFTKALCM